MTSRRISAWSQLATRLVTLGLGGVLLSGCGSEAGDSADPEIPNGETRPACSTPRIAEGDLQNQASGASVFGIAVGGEPGLFDALGDSECGIVGVRICLFGTDTCTESDAAGQFVLGGLPENEDLEISFQKADSVSVLRLVHTGATPVNLRQTRVITRAGGSSLLAAVGEQVDETKGSMVAVALAAGEGIGSFVLADNVVMTIVPGGYQPLYSRGAVEPDGLSSDALDRDLQATKLGGWGLFVNVEPGDYAVRFERAGTLCAQALPGFGYGLDVDGNVRTKIVTGYQTAAIAAYCP